MRLIAHRGASGHAPENTLASVSLALAMRAKAVEIDVHLTRDGALAVLHDKDLKRVASRRAKVRDLSWAELAAIDVGSWFGPGFAGERVPRLEEVMRLVAGKAELHIEIKRGSRLYPGIEGRVVDAIRDFGAEAWSVVSSFDHRALYAVRALAPGLRLGYLLGLTTMRRALRETGQLQAESLNISLRQATPRRVRLAHERGLKVLVYTVNKAKDMARVEKMGVDGVFSNYPGLAPSGFR